MKFDGRQYADKIYDYLKIKLHNSKVSHRKMVWIASGKDPASEIYGRLKELSAIKLGFEFEKIYVDGDIFKIKEIISEKSLDDNVDGIMIQLPLLNYAWKDSIDVLNLIPESKDIDGLSLVNIGKLVAGIDSFWPATVLAVGFVLSDALRWHIVPGDVVSLKSLFKPLAGLRVAIVGGGWEVGKPLVMVLSNWGASVCWARSSEKDLKVICMNSDIVISATGYPDLIKKDYLKSDVIIIDVGSPTRDFHEECYSKASFYTPVPGGLGPVTVACLMANLVSAER